MLRSLVELAAYGTLAVLLVAASVAPEERATSIPATAPTASADRGRMLFMTKGCVGCHVHPAVARSRMSVGPNLSGLTERAGARVPGLDARAYVMQSLREPQAFVVPGFEPVPMPDLRLTDEEVESLTAFLLAPGR
jgi:cytochrome c551/c552